MSDGKDPPKVLWPAAEFEPENERRTDALGHADPAITPRVYADVIRSAEVAPPTCSRGKCWQRPLATRSRGAFDLGAACRNRTDDLFITSESLCRLS